MLTQSELIMLLDAVVYCINRSTDHRNSDKLTANLRAIATIMACAINTDDANYALPAVFGDFLKEQNAMLSGLHYRLKKAGFFKPVKD